jgi:hypothetical protein
MVVIKLPARSRARIIHHEEEVMAAATLLLGLAFLRAEAEKQITATEKKAFLELLPRLPTHGEFFTDEAVQKAMPHTRVLLALTPKDIEKCDIYPFLALSRGLLDCKEQRDYGVKHFGTIAHPTLKLAWGSMLFDAKAVSPEIVAFLRAALESKEQSKRLSQMLGPSFEDFKKRVMKHKVEEK